MPFFLPDMLDPRRLARRGSRGHKSAEIEVELRDGVVPSADDLAATAEAELGPPQGPNYRTIAMIVACALFMEHLDATVLATALPTMAREFSVPVTEMSVALTSYLLALAVCIPASGALADRLGAKTAFQASIVLFIIGSIACGLAPNLPALAAARFVQGIGGAIMMPVGRLVLLRSVSKSDLVSAMSWLLMPAMVGPILGPPVGGFIITYLDWRWIFWLNIPIGILGVGLVARFIVDSREDVVRPFDLWGFVLSSASLGCLLTGFEMSIRPGEGRTAALLLAIGFGAGVLYLAHARRTAHPILDTSLLRFDTFRLALIGGSFTRITQGAQPFLLPMMMQLAFGLTAAASGLVTVAVALGAFAMKGLARPILARFGFRSSLVVVGVLAVAAYSICGLFSPRWPLPAVFAVLATCGFLMSFQFTAYNTIAYDEIEKGQMSTATTFYSTFQQLILSFGVCTGALALQASMLWSNHDKPEFGDFSVAFWTVNAISLMAIFANLSFDRQAGAEMSGRRPD